MSAFFSKQALASASIFIEGNSVEIVNTVGNTPALQTVYKLVNKLLSVFSSYTPRDPVAHNSFYIPITNITTVGKVRVAKPLQLLLMCAAICVAILMLGFSISRNFVVGFIFLVVGLVVAISVYVAVRFRYSFSIEVNSGAQYLMVSKNLSFLQATYTKIKSIVDNPTQVNTNNFTFDFNNAKIFGSNIDITGQLIHEAQSANTNKQYSGVAQ